MTTARPFLDDATFLRNALCGLVLIVVLIVAAQASAYTLDYCKSYADKVVQESTSAELSTAMRGTTSDPGLSGIVGSGSTSGSDSSLSSILGGLTQSQEQKSLWQRTFDHCMGVTR